MVPLLMSLAVSACSALADPGKPLLFTLIDNAIVVPVTVSGQGPFRFLLDTGSSRSALSESLTKQLRPIVVSRTQMLTPVGHSIRPIVSVQLGLGALAPVRVAATVVDDDDLENVRVDGIVGQDVLASLAYSIDYRNRTISWHSRTPAAIGDRLPLEFAGGSLLVAITADGGVSEPLRLIPDTGSDALVLFERGDRPLPALTPLDVGLLRTLSGKQLVRRVLVNDFRLGDVTLRDQPAVVLGGKSVTLPVGDGLLPLHLFSRVTINGPGRYMVVQK
jgi:hypothetical protein